MERDLRIKAFMEEYARLMSLFDDIMTMKNAMLRLEVYMVIMVCQIACGVMAAGVFLLCRMYHSHKTRGEYELEHRFERPCQSCNTPSPSPIKPTADIPNLVKKPTV
ncbi:unnamed protein product, partial [Mesorhabditis belari]|uniref:Uncharacterized protein n=1 Tax=Mesorhabditis belari TaxID=2138241 RepID=A0AAF3FGC0_9BILA